MAAVKFKEYSLWCIYILKMISLISNGILPAANSMFAPNGKLIRGIHIHLMWELQELEGVEEDTNARD